MGDRLSKIFATGFGAGYFPYGPGTMGAILACFILWVLHWLFPASFGGKDFSLPFLTLIICCIVIGIITGNYLEGQWGKDASRIVIDEMAGMWIATFMIPLSLYTLLAGLIIFRLFDIFKPLYIRKVEKLKGGWGVMMDDVLAGLYANLVLQLIISLDNL